MNTISASSLARLIPLAVARPAGGWVGQARQLLQGCTAAVLGSRSAPVRTAAARALPPPMVSLEISPLVAAAGVSRQISITSYWPLGSAPGSVRVIDEELPSSKTLVIRMEPAGNATCALPLVPYQQVVEYTPTREGELQVMVVNGGDEVIASCAGIRTRNLGGSFSQFDISGRWRDATGGDGGVTFVHNRIRFRRDHVAGTWLLYDANGQPRRYIVDEVTWKEGGMEAEGKLYETASGGPGTLTRSAQLGRVRIALRNDRSARVYAIGFRGGILFMSNLERMAS